MSRGNTLITPLILAVISIVGLVLSFNIERSDVFDPSSPAFMPAVLSTIMLVCSIAIGWRGIKSLSPSASGEPRAEQGNATLENAESTAESGPEAEQMSAGSDSNAGEQRRAYLNIAIFLVLLTVYAYLMSYVNFFVLSIFFLLFSMLLLNRKKWRSAVVVSIIAAAVIYFSFVYLFEVVFPN